MRHTEYKIDNRDTTETWLHLKDEAIVSVNPFELVLNVIQNCGNPPEQDALKVLLDRILIACGGT